MAIKRGTAGNDTITGTALADDLYGLAGNDSLKGLAGADRLWGGSGIDALFSGDGNDQLYGEGSDDFLDAGAGDDFVHGGSGADRMRGGDGNDRLVTGLGDDARGGTGNDVLIFEATGVQKAGSTLLMGESGTDTLTINADAATVSTNGGTAPAYVGIFMGPSGSAGTLNFNNGTGGDSVDVGQFSGLERFSVGDATQLYFVGGALNATVSGSNQSDFMAFGSGNETFNGRGGADDFVIFSSSGDTDKIVGFNAAEDQVWGDIWFNSNGDRITNRTITEAGGETIVTTSSFAGEVLHTLHIDAVGLPQDVFRDWGTYSG
jgi:Ca2+-binding RTX toxin-like protein